MKETQSSGIYKMIPKNKRRCGMNWDWFFLILVFSIGYLAIILEYYIKLNKSAVALFIGVACWTIFLYTSNSPVSADLKELGHHVSEISQIIFFLMGAMTLV